MTDSVVVRAVLRLLPADQGGRRSAIASDYRPSWNLRNTWFDRPTINDGRVVVDDAGQIAPGGEGAVRIEPLAPEFWGRVSPGDVLPMQEGPRVVGYATVVDVERPALLGPDVTAFVVEAHQFCDFVVRAAEHPLPERLRRARRLLLRLSDAAASLPRVDAVDVVEPGSSPAAPATWPGFAELDSYRKVFDPYEQAPLVVGSLSDDVLDVWRDVERGLALWKRGERRAAVWVWRFHFDAHWGDHAADALRALHRACARASRG